MSTAELPKLFLKKSSRYPAELYSQLSNCDDNQAKGKRQESSSQRMEAFQIEAA